MFILTKEQSIQPSKAKNGTMSKTFQESCKVFRLIQWTRCTVNRWTHKILIADTLYKTMHRWPTSKLFRLTSCQWVNLTISPIDHNQIHHIDLGLIKLAHIRSVQLILLNMILEAEMDTYRARKILVHWQKVKWALAFTPT